MNTLKEYIKQIYYLTRFDIYIVGNVLIDYLLKKEIKNIDIVLKKDAIQTAKKFAEKIGKVIKIDEQEGTANVILEDTKKIIKFSNMQGKDIINDLENQVFSINAMAVKVNKDGTFNMEDMIDPFGGVKDINNRLIRSVKATTFEENPLNMLIAVRLMAKLGFDLEKTTAELIKKNAQKILSLDWKDISKELFYILGEKRTYYYIQIMDKELHLFDKLFPEIIPMKEVGRCDYHVVDAWTHSLYALKEIESIIYANGYFEYHLRCEYEKHIEKIFSNGHTRMQLVKLATLFHDIGKPKACWIDEKGKTRFRGHEILGVEIIEKIADRLQLNQEEKWYLSKMVKEHMWPLGLYKRNDVSGKTTYDLFKNLKEDTLDVLLISLADIISTRKLLYPNEEMGMYKIHIEYLANNYLTRFKNIQDISEILREEDIKKKFSIKDPKKIEILLEEIKKAIFLGKIPPVKENAILYIKENVLKKEN
ncbi:CCA tRNA nucleotidyltransferase [Crassaminicella thermophila]|uniref:CCA tRNA nucleotidyltransferase n=1 Tax=Crassaminicella thermophila TaxID=2599308 RepID=A0A5C0SGF4_CRATE|nr:HD domain-containing protein [Crassaminicella thermophila]QEK13391.1 CCA tRNA nucleotidyltransferase [Crassaminicella thermophila]